MGGTSNIEVLKDYVLVRINGSAFQAVDIMATIAKLFKMRRKQPFKKILVVREESVKMMTSLFYLYKLARFLIYQSSRKVQVALVFPKDMHTDALQGFVMVSQDGGMNIELFSDAKIAEKWLMAQKDTEDEPNMEYSEDTMGDEITDEITVSW